MKMCRHMDLVLKLAKGEGNTVLSVSKSESMDKVIWMNNKLSKSLREKILLEIKELEYKKDSDKPHAPGTEYFICWKCKSVIVFPLRTAY